MKARLSSILPFIGLGLLLVTFGVAAYNILNREVKSKSGTVIRIAHWQLEGGVEQGFEAVIREYEKLNPGVHVEQMRIPERVYGQWLTTQFVGGTAPDLVQINGRYFNAEKVARYFVPITDEVELPNPYNVGTEHEGKPLRATFVDDMQGSYDETNNEYFGAAMFMGIVRVYYNAELMRRITGDEKPPATYDELIALCRKVKEYSQRTGIKVTPIAGSRDTAGSVLDTLAFTQTQKLTLLNNPARRLDAGDSLWTEFLKGKWSLDEPSVRGAFSLIGEISEYISPGFLSLTREDAMFQFTQGKALMIATGSWEVSSIRQLSPFKLGLFRMPAPGPDDPVYGANTLGGRSEGNVRGYGSFGIPNTSPNYETALDFLRFFASKKGNGIFSEVSGWLPIISGVEIDPFTRSFLPVLEGYPGGTNFSLLSLTIGPDSRQLLEQQIFNLIPPFGSVDKMLGTWGAQLPAAVRSDMVRKLKDRGPTMRRRDAVIGALQTLGQDSPNNERAKTRLNVFRDTQVLDGIDALIISRDLAAKPASASSEK